MSVELGLDGGEGDSAELYVHRGARPKTLASWLRTSVHLTASICAVRVDRTAGSAWSGDLPFIQ